MLFIDNSPLLHWIFSFITYHWVSSEIFATPLLSFALHLHPLSPSFTHFLQHLLDGTDTAQPSSLESSSSDFSPLCELTFYCYLCFLSLNQVKVQTWGVVLMEPQLTFHKSLWSGTLLKVIRKVDSISPVHFLPFKLPMGALELIVMKTDDEVFPGLCSKIVFQMLISHWCFRRWCTKPVGVHKFCVLMMTSWYTCTRCCNDFTSRQALSAGGSGKGDRTFWNWKIPHWILISRDMEIWKSSACDLDKFSRSWCLVETIGIFEFLYQAHGNVFTEENVLIYTFCAHAWGFYLFLHIRNYGKCL